MPPPVHGKAVITEIAIAGPIAHLFAQDDLARMRTGGVFDAGGYPLPDRSTEAAMDVHGIPASVPSISALAIDFVGWRGGSRRGAAKAVRAEEAHGFGTLVASDGGFRVADRTMTETGRRRANPVGFMPP
jgi:hypothetical protein